MKRVFITLLTIATLISCSKDEIVKEASKLPISFGNVFVENSTRATDNTYGSTNVLKHFNVYGTVTGNSNTVNIYNGDAVKGTIGGDWNCDKVQYWVPDCTYSFTAIVDGDVKNGTTVLNSVAVDENGMPTSITYNATTQKDLLLAQSIAKTDESGVPTNGNITTDTSSNKFVSFTFSHLLAKAQFTFTNKFTADSGVELTVTDIKITNALKEAVYTISPAGWAAPTESNYVLSFGNSEQQMSANGGRSTSGKVCLLIPGTYNLNIEFTINHNKGGNSSTKTINQNVTLLAGNSYNFTAELNASNVNGVVPITFNITSQNDWGSDDDFNPSVGPVYPPESN